MCVCIFLNVYFGFAEVMHICIAMYLASFNFNDFCNLVLLLSYHESLTHQLPYSGLISKGKC